VLILDIQMPGMTGLEGRANCKRQVPRRVRDGVRQVRHRRFEQGAVDYVLKPFSTARLAETVRAAQGSVCASGPPTSNILSLLASKHAERK
jgi:CheY-like chemotaxis protein